ncbi:MAG: trypsin-like peptidase domain-containing protein [Candidatus Levybacteria bacterium]|nr:trypsin-like peptidase domain-containing protein [Candidatus Levybacteria bacterium]
MRKLILILTIFIILLTVWSAATKNSAFKQFLSSPKTVLETPSEKVKVVSEESVVIDVVDKVTPSVVTVGIEQRISQIDPFDPFNFFQRPRGTTNQEQDIGSGFIVSEDGLIVTNKHVVSGQGKYKVITKDGNKYDVTSIYRDPSNDIAVIKVNPSSGLGFRPVEMGDSSKIKVGQLVVAVGTPLGEFRGSVTKGIVSGIGRGITAGSPFEGFAEQLDDVIQTDAAINPGNSGGPLVNSAGQVIGINTAIASGAENIGFAIPINVVKDALANFRQTGGFNRSFLGVSYRLISRDVAILNNLPEGALVQEVVADSAADKAGIVQGDIITKIDGTRVQEKNGGLAGIIGKKKVGDQITITVWREDENSPGEGKGETLELKATLEAAPNQ